MRERVDVRGKTMRGKSIRYYVLSIKGFTLIELLVVISIMGALASILFVSFTGSQKQARDAQRKSDVVQYQTALEGFANVNSDFFPSFTTTVSAKDTLCPAIPKNISRCIDDVRRVDDATFVYNYQSNGTGSGTTTATQYVLWGKLENSADYWVVCSAGKNGTKAQTGFAVSGGTCPI